MNWKSVLSRGDQLSIWQCLGLTVISPVLLYAELGILLLINSILSFALSVSFGSLFENGDNFGNIMFWFPLGGMGNSDAVAAHILFGIIPWCILGLCVLALWIWRSWRRALIPFALFIPDIIIYLILVGIQSTR